MTKRLIIRILLILLGVFIVMTLMYFILNYLMFNYWYEVPFSDYIQPGIHMYKSFIVEGFIHGDFGLTWEGEVLAEVVFPKFWISLQYVLAAMVISVIFGVVIGVLTAYYKGSWFDKIVGNTILIIGSLPTYLIFTICIVLFGYALHILPKNWYFVYFEFWSPFSGYIIPMIALSAYPILKIAHTIRSEIIEILGSEHFTLCRAKGLTKFQAIKRHALKEALIPTMSVLSDLAIFTLGASFIVEVYYNVPGVAEILFNALIQMDPDLGFVYIFFDINSVVLIVSYYMAAGMLLILVTDIIHYFIDPTMRYKNFS